MPHPLILQLRFTRSELMRALEGVSEADAQRRFLPMNCISWNIGHLAWQEQRYFLFYAQAQMPRPDINDQFAYGAPASTPELAEIRAAWQQIAAAADPWLDKVTTEILEQSVVRNGRAMPFTYGNLLLRTIYHYWYHIGENMAIRQNLGQVDLPQFVGDIDGIAPYRPEQ